ncbi:MAG: N-acetylmuramoyl-L-alanine amidase [Kouleothrix sp.]|nr:N-acetylmuramoyl-L-alanine amidase [Kouleothrix sp.]
MRSIPLRRWTLGLIAVPIALTAALLRAPSAAVAPPAPLHNAIAAAPTSSATPPPTATAQPTPPPSATPAPTSTPTTRPDSTPTPRPADTPPHVGIQVGHWRSSELPDELKRLRSSTGAFAGGYKEADVNLNVATRVVELLKSRGIAVDLLPATIPPAYDADAIVAIHADGSTSAGSRGFKLATPWRTSRASQQLLDTLTAEYATATGLPQDDAITFNMKGYYAFNYRRHTHAIARTTPAVIIEMGFLTNAADRAVMIGRADDTAIGIANGIIRYLNERDRSDGDALLPPEFKTQRPLAAEGVDVHSAPSDKARVVAHVQPDGRLFVFLERDGWYQVFVRGAARVTGWVRKDQVVDTDDPPPTPPPATDS